MSFNLLYSFFQGLKPEPRLTVSEWSDQHRYLDSKTSSEHGLYRTSRTPYLQEPMDALSATNVIQWVVVMKGVQLGFTEFGINWMGYVIDNAPASGLAIWPTDEMMKSNSKMRVQSMIDASPRLREKVKPSRSKDSGNTINQKEFPGGVWKMIGANSSVGFSSMPARNIMMDEVDRYPMDVEGEGSPISLAEKRTSTFGTKKKILIGSTPTISNASVIEKEFALTDQRYYHVPCPHCGSMQILKFKNLRWEPKNYDRVVYVCDDCEAEIEERFKPQMLEAGRWIATAPEKANPYRVGYHISTLYSPYGWKAWWDIAKEWDEAQGDDNKLKTFYNTLLGETWKEKADAPEWELLYNRAEDISKVKDDVVFITAGVDVQADRLEVEIVGWMVGKKTQSIDYVVLLGRTDDGAVWEDLAGLLSKVFEKEDGTALPIRMMAVDTGYNTHEVYKWCRKQSVTRVIPIKGQDKLETYFNAPKTVDIAKHGQKIGKIKIWNIGVSFIKTEVYSYLRNTIDPETGHVPDGYCWFPKRDAHYFKGLTAEGVQMVANAQNYLKSQWVKIYPRNEPLDCRVYARAAAAVIGMDRWNDARWERERSVGLVAAKLKAPPKKKEKNKNSFWNGYR